MRDLNTQPQEQIALRPPAELGKAFPGEPQDGIGLGTLRDRDFELALDRGHLASGAERGFRNREGLFPPKVGAGAFEARIRRTAVSVRAERSSRTASSCGFEVRGVNFLERHDGRLLTETMIPVADSKWLDNQGGAP